MSFSCRTGPKTTLFSPKIMIFNSEIAPSKGRSSLSRNFKSKLRQNYSSSKRL